MQVMFCRAPHRSNVYTMVRSHALISRQMYSPTSCQSMLTFLSLGTVVGCCGEGAISTCPDLYTSCVDTSSLCDASCSANSKVLKW